MRTAEVCRAILPPGPVHVERGPAANLALEEALFLRNQGVTLRVWENSESVIIGRAQLARYETDVDYCRREGIPVVRRFTAGGAVYNGPGNLNWSIFVASSVSGAGRLRYESSPRAIFERSSRPLVSALLASGVEARLEPPNRVVTRDGKVSGMAAYVSRSGFLCHGTLLYSADLERVKSLTTPSPEPIHRRYTRSRDARTANVPVEADSFIRTLVETLAEETGLTFETSAPDRGDLLLMEDLTSRRYSNDAWNLGDPFERDGPVGTPFR